MAVHLNQRLQAALAMAAPCELCADIGADHGQLCAALLEAGLAKRVLASDISARSLEKSKLLLAEAGLADKARFAVADGLKALEALAANEKADTVFILGMGGVTLSRILRSGAHRLRGATLILGGQSDLPMLRQTLCDIGYRLRKEAVVCENRHDYVLMRASPALNGEAAYTERELFLGPMLLKEQPPLWQELLEHKLRRQEAAIRAIEGADAAKHQARLLTSQKERDYLTEALRYYEREGRT